jgi:hypothetical protein
MLGARTPSSALSAAGANSFILLARVPEDSSRFALSADEGVRAPSMKTPANETLRISLHGKLKMETDRWLTNK